jgi:hypothetical protein
MMACTLHASWRASKRLVQLQARTNAHTKTYKQTSIQRHKEHMSACRSTRTHEHTRAHMRTHTPGVPGDDTVCFPHTLFTQHLLLAHHLHALAYTPTHTHTHATAHTPNAHVHGGLLRRMDARMGARGACCSRPSPIPSLHLFLVGGPPVTAGSLSRPPHHLDAPLRLTTSLACRSTILCTLAQGRCAAREPEESSRRMHSQARDGTGYDSDAGLPWEGMDYGLKNHRRAEGSGDSRRGGGMLMMC